MKPMRALSRGLVASAVGTLAMDFLWFARYRRGGGDESFPAWEFSSGIESWDDAPAPAQAANRIVEALTGHTIPVEQAGLVNNVMHWGFGLANGAQYALLERFRREPRIRDGLPFALGVWATGYAVLPALGVYKPIWEYDTKTLAKDLSAHLVYGLGTAMAYKALSR
jgi:hypothetical protein